MAEILAAWTDAAARLDHMAEAGLAPLLGDITCHEHDIRGAIGRPGARDSAAVWWASDRLLADLRTPLPLHVTVEDAQYPDVGAPHYTIRGPALADRPP